MEDEALMWFLNVLTEPDKTYCHIQFDKCVLYTLAFLELFKPRSKGP